MPNATFERAVDFSHATFGGVADFSESTFVGAAYFSEATFRGEASFSDVIFKEKAVFDSGIFDRTTFEGPTYFIGVTFEGAAYFGHVTFKGLTVFSKWLGRTRTAFKEGAFFSGATFEGATTFSEAQFSGEWTDFDRAQFSGTYLTDFSEAEFGSGQTSFQEATFNGLASFSEATFKEKVTFWGTQKKRVFDTQAWVWFHDSRIEKPELLTFNTVLLHPGWFINTDVRKVDFTDVDWYGMPGGPEGALDEEIHALKMHALRRVSPITGEDREIESPHTLLAQACRRLSVNAEENREYPLANEFHYWSMDAVRKESWSHFKGLTLESLAKKETWRDIRKHFGLVTTLYWALSGYGVRAGRALGVLVVVWAVFAILYMLLGPPELRVFSPEVWWLPSILAGFPAFVPSELDLISVRSIGEGMGHIGQAMVYSLSTLARLNPKPEPEPGLFQFLVTIEGILGPLQIALLALAIRRKVMR